jgi:hypothetical protein
MDSKRYMPPRNILAQVFLCILFLSCISWLQAARTTPVIRQVDRILVESVDPRALFSLLADTLQLPAAWPISENEGYISGGVGAGNVILELFRYAGRQAREAHFSGLAFEPYPLEDALRRLQMLKIAYSPPQPSVGTLPSGSTGVAWTTVDLPSFSKPAMSIFLYEYSPVFLRADVRRKQLGNRLMLNNGGPLGIVSATEIVIGTTHLKEDKQAWGLLLNKPAESGNWRIGAGPAIRLVGGGQDGIQEIVLRVQSLDRARVFLKEINSLGAVSPDRIYIRPSKIQRLRISLTDK